MDMDSISNGIRLAVAPVFLLTAVSGMIGAVVGRLARIIDRARILDGRIRQNPDHPDSEGYLSELRQLRLRGRLANTSIGLLTACAFLIGLTIVLLFVGETTLVLSARWSVYSFLAGVISFLLALLFFMAETVNATRVLHFPVLKSENKLGK
jgi:Protein of unknown function (DUF2721)